MPLGSVHAHLSDSTVPKIYRRLFGFEEFHTHIRWAAIKGYIDFSARRTLEVGADLGFMVFEIAQRNPDGHIVASEFNPEAVEKAKLVAERAGLTNVEVVQEDLLELQRYAEPFDQVLVIDVFEHIEDDVEAMRQVHAVLRPGGRIVVSVPSPTYNDHFGKPFADSIGHVRPGYTAEEMSAKLASAGFRIIASHYYTGKIAGKMCQAYYKRALPTKIGWALMPLAFGIALPAERLRSAGAAGGSLALVAEAI